MPECARCGRDYDREASEKVFPDHDGDRCLICTAYIDEFGRDDKPTAAERADHGE